MASTTTVASPTVRSAASCRFSFTATIDGLAVSVPEQSVRTDTTFTSSHVERVYCLKDQALAQAATRNLDLTADFPTALTSIKYIGIFITSTTGRLRVGGAASNANGLWFVDTTDKADIWPTGPGFQQGNTATAVTVDGTHKIILLDNVTGSGAVTYTVIVAGDD